MNAFAEELNDLLVTTFHSILKLEESALEGIAQGVSLGEMHLLEAVARGKQGGRTISDIAAELNITLPSVTMAVNKLVRKGFVIKERSQEDKRVVYVLLSAEGRRAEVAHRYFHRQMVHEVTRGMSPQEEKALLKGLRKLRAFFDQQQHQLHNLLPKTAPHPQEAVD